MRIGEEAFLRLLRENPEISFDVMRQLAERIAQSTERLEELQGQLQRYETKFGALTPDH